VDTVNAQCARSDCVHRQCFSEGCAVKQVTEMLCVNVFMLIYSICNCVWYNTWFLHEFLTRRLVAFNRRWRKHIRINRCFRRMERLWVKKCFSFHSFFKTWLNSTSLLKWQVRVMVAQGNRKARNDSSGTNNNNMVPVRNSRNHQEPGWAWWSFTGFTYSMFS